MKKTFAALAAAVAMTVGLATNAVAVTASIGNDALDRQSRDTWINFTIVDTNNPARFDGYFTSIEYYAERVDTIRFVVVDANDDVTWVSDEIIPTAAGVQTVAFTEPVGVTTGSNLGVYSKNDGVVSFDYNGAAEPAWFEGFNVGLPDVGDALVYVGSSERYYSMNATITASSPTICKNGGWETYGYPNQGQCIASVVANDNAGKI